MAMDTDTVMDMVTDMVTVTAMVTDTVTDTGKRRKKKPYYNVLPNKH